MKLDFWKKKEQSSNKPTEKQEQQISRQEDVEKEGVLNSKPEITPEEKRRKETDRMYTYYKERLTSAEEWVNSIIKFYKECGGEKYKTNPKSFKDFTFWISDSKEWENFHWGITKDTELQDAFLKGKDEKFYELIKLNLSALQDHYDFYYESQLSVLDDLKEQMPPISISIKND